MIINKIGHCCLLIKHKGLTILTDPGDYTVQETSNLTNIDLILITHEHPDHLHIESIKQLIKNNPEVKIVTNISVGALLKNENILYQVVNDGEGLEIELEPSGKFLIEAFGNEHALVHKSIEPVQNTGFFLDNILFYPGDSFTNPTKKVDVLALPVAGPWLKIGESINYALEIKPRVCFPVHDALLKEFGTTHKLPETILAENGIKFIELDGQGDTDVGVQDDSTNTNQEEGTMGL